MVRPLLPSARNVSQTGFKAANGVECLQNTNSQTEGNLNRWWGRENGPRNEGKILISGAKSCLFDLLQIARNSQWNSTEALAVLLWMSWGMQMNWVSKYDVHSQVAASLIVGFTAENRKLHLAARLREASTTPDLVVWADFWISRQRDRSRGRGGGHYPAGDTVTADTQKRHTDSNWRLRLPPLCPLSWVRHCCSITKAQIAPSPPFQLFVITCRFFVSINQLDGWSLHEEDIWAISGDLGLKFGKWRNIDQISETPKCYPV